MKDTINRLQHSLTSGTDYILGTPDSELSIKPNPQKWSKKEILGHLIDSGINNLQRFTEIEFEAKPYAIRRYNQDALVLANDYQHGDLKELLDFWVAVNRRIVRIMERQTPETLSFAIKLSEGSVSDLRYLMTDYVDHMEHHLKQIIG